MVSWLETSNFRLSN